MEIDKILTEELKRHGQINSYVTNILEQEEDIIIDNDSDGFPLGEDCDVGWCGYGRFSHCPPLGRRIRHIAQFSSVHVGQVDAAATLPVWECHALQEKAATAPLRRERRVSRNDSNVLGPKNSGIRSAAELRRQDLIDSSVSTPCSRRPTKRCTWSSSLARPRHQGSHSSCLGARRGSL